MQNINNTTLDDFYQEIATSTGLPLSQLLPQDIHKEIGHFNVFDISRTFKEVKQNHIMPYNRRSYYKISCIRGKNKAEYADKVIDIKKNALLFATPKVPYHWIPLDEHQGGTFCVFTAEFLLKNKTGVTLDELPIFKSGGHPVFEISDEQAEELGVIFDKMQKEIATDYAFKYDLLRNYVMELIHYGQKLQPDTTLRYHQNASTRIISLFIELLERQFSLQSTDQRLMLKTAKEYADRLAIHVNHLNKIVKENTGHTTTELISSRITQEAKILLKQTDWNISEIAYKLGYEEIAHFSNFFKKQTSLTPLAFRS